MNRVLQSKSFRLLMSIFFAFGCASVVCPGQDRPNGPPPFGDKHIGGDVPIDERLTDASKAGRRVFSPPPEDRVLKKGVLAPSQEDRTTFAGFLRMPNTGLIRLLPPGNIYLNGASSAPREQSYYSFANITHFIGYGSDIALKGDQLVVGVPALGYGMLATLGDVPLEQIQLSDQRLRFLSAYRPAVTLLEERAEASRLSEGIVIDGIRYQSSLPVDAASTYLLRSINYGPALLGLYGRGNLKGMARQTDVLVAFKVVRKDVDRSVTIAWKLLKKYSAPKVYRTTDNILSTEPQSRPPGS